MAKAHDTISQLLDEITHFTSLCSTVEQLIPLGQKAWRDLVPLFHGGEESLWEQVDDIFRAATERIAAVNGRRAISRTWHHGWCISPMPIVGTRVWVWIPGKPKLFAADVTNQLSQAGSIEVSLVRGSHDQGVQQFHEPVTHASHPQHETKQLIKWDYLPGVIPAETDWKFQKDDIAVRERRHVEALKQEEERAKRDRMQIARDAKAQKAEAGVA